MSFQRHTKEEGLEQVRQLVEQFRKNLRNYKSPDYLEANCKEEFIGKLLVALNWDVSNENGFAPKYKEVVMEAKTNERGVVKHPDYALCMGGRPVFYLEAKPPSAKLLNDEKCAMQLRQYASHMEKPLSVLTNFLEFCVYDTRHQPKEGDAADTRRVKYLTFDEYEKEFDYLWDAFSYDAVSKGSVDNYFDKTDGNYYKNDVSHEVLDAVEEWRQLMVKSVKAKGGQVTEENVNMAVQRLINRFVYIWRNKGY